MAKTRKVRAFRDLKLALEDSLAYTRGEAVNLRVTEIPAPPKRLTPREIKEIRTQLNANQKLFAQYLNVSPRAVQSWEQGQRRPQEAALKLLNIARRNPQALLA